LCFLRNQGVPEEKLHLKTSVEWWEIDDERQCLREPITAEMKKAIFIRNHYEYVYCSARGILEVDHIYPISLGGTSEMENLITACNRCNRCNGRKRDRATPFPMVFGRFREAIEKSDPDR
jgi:5-methylcytosine-specific restriction endonuclease McrA